MFLQFGNAAGRPLLDELGIMQSFVQDGVSHCQSNCAIGPGKGCEPFVTGAGRVGQANVKGDQLRTVLETSILDTIGQWHVSLVGFECIRAEVQDVFAVFDVIQIPVALPEICQIGRSAISGAQRTVAKLRLGAERIEKTLQCVLAALPALVEGELFGFS